MTGTPLDLTPFGPLLKGLGHLYWVVALAILLLALWWPKRWWLKLTSAAIVAAAVVYPVFVRPIEKHVEAANEEQLQFKERLNAAAAHFEMRCKSAGEKITRTVENVEGVVWMKWRDNYDVNDDYDQFKLSDPYGRDCNAEACIEQLLRATKGGELDPENKTHSRHGYRFVESVDPSTRQLRRYLRQIYRQKERDSKYAEWAVASEVVSEPIDKSVARYGITWDDVSTREDREHWVAGSSLKVIDLHTNEVIAERVGYMWDRGLGSRVGARTPWLLAVQSACPAFPQVGPTDSRRNRDYRQTDTLKFGSKVLKQGTRD